MNRRETFEKFEEPRYLRACSDLLHRLDEFSDAEAIAVLGMANASLAIRQAASLADIVRSKLIEQNRTQQVLGQVGNRSVSQSERTG